MVSYNMGTFPNAQVTARLVEFFGETGAAVVLNHVGHLEEIFGSSSEIISTIANGDLLNYLKS
jgi:hypothetical protein